MVFIKKFTLSCILLIVILSVNCFNLSAQISIIDSIDQKINFYNAKKSHLILFAHFDKTVYAQNENVWFTAYLLNRKSTDNPDVLSVSLVNNLNKSVVLERKFLIVAGISFGNVFLTDTIPVGNYSFMLYTNQFSRDKPEDIFIQPIIVAATNELTFKASVQLDTINTNPNSKKIVMTAVTKEGRPIPGAAINYIIGNTKYPLLKGNAKTDNEGKCLIIIPVGQINAGNNVFEANIKYNKDIEKVNLVIPFENKKVSVKFYPEGGYLVHSTACQVGLEVTRDGIALKTTGILYKDNIPVDTIETDSYGMGRFKLIPLKGSVYAVKLMGSVVRDSIFKLPEIIIKNPAINIAHALANDTLKMTLTSKFPETVTVMVHNYSQIFYAFSVKASAAGKIVLINLKNLPKGLATITILDSAQRPCAERLFFAHFNKRSEINIQTDKSQYAKREKISLSLKFKTPDTGFVSVACVQSNRVQIKNSNDIESYLYLKNELGALPLKDNYMGNSEVDRAYLENILLVKGWRRYKWQEMMQTNVTDTISSQKTLAFTGWVNHLGRSLKKPVKFVVMTDSATSTVTTDKKGDFKLNNNLIITDEDKKVRLLVMDKNKGDYYISINDPYKNINQALAATDEFKYSLSVSNITDSLILKGLEHAIVLKEVKIKAVKDNSILNSSAEKLMPTENECGDYICMFGIFNCPNHKGFANNIIPKDGEYYMIRGRKTRYFGCVLSLDKDKKKNLLSSIEGIKYSKEFYGEDYSVFNPSQPEYYSTIFWKHLIKVNSSNEVQLNFYASDITGAFKVIVQGITENDVVYGGKEFNVK